MNHKRTLRLTVSILSIVIMLLIEVTSSLGDTQLTTSDKDDFHPAITQTSDNKIWVVWHSARTGNADIFCNVHDGASWLGEEQLTNDAGVDAAASITQANDGKIWIVWMSSRRGNHDLFYKTKPMDVGSPWSVDNPLTSDTGSDKSPSIMKANDGKIWVVWQSNRTGYNDLFYKFSSDNGETWSAEMNATDTTDLNDDREPSIAQDIDGKIWVVWQRYRNENWDIFSKTFNGLSWSTDMPITSDPQHDSNPSVTRTIDGALWIVWQSSRPAGFQYDIYYKIFNGTWWSSENKLTWYMDVDIAPTIFQAANQTIWLVWSLNKDSNFDIYYKFVIVDITIKSVTPSATSVPHGNSVNITVQVQNEGTATATFNLTTYYNNNVIKTETRTWTPGLMPYYTIHTWNTTGVALGNYIISARVSPVIGETDTADNTYIGGQVTVGIHDIAVKNVTSSRNLVHRGYMEAKIFVEIRNEGTFSEILTVTAYYNSTKIGIQTLTLPPSGNTILTFNWSTQNVLYGDYTIKAELSPVPGESDTADNVFSDGTVTITIPGDISGDGRVSLADLTELNVHWYDPPAVGLEGYHPNADVNNDGVVDVFDYAIISVNWLKSW